VIPVNGDGAVLDAKGAADRGYSGVVGWMQAAERRWNGAAESGMTLTQRWNYHNELGAQFPIAQLRVVYSKAGTLPAAAIVRDARAVIDHKLYWSAFERLEEASYLTAILNSDVVRRNVSSLQSLGQFGARDFDKVMFTLPIPRFDPSDELHERLATLSFGAEKLAATVELDDGVRFQRARRFIREALLEAGISRQIDEAVCELLALRKEDVQ
jgi:hypothetical protein